MRIISGNVRMESARSYQAYGAAKERGRSGEYREQSESHHAFQSAFSSEKEALWERERSRHEEENGEAAPGERIAGMEGWNRMFALKSWKADAVREEDVPESLRQITLQYLFELLFAMRRGRLREWLRGQGEPMGISLTDSSSEGIRKESIQRSETESTAFLTEGIVRTSDGREICFRVKALMSRTFEEKIGTSAFRKAAALCDPLVINLDTPSAQVSDQTFLFDLDGDGTQEETRMPVAGSAFLAADLDGDGRIGDGTELFGTRSGDGFRDLAQYDSDGNGWIDENDPIWDKLRVWTKDSQGRDLVYRLAEKGVGAICLGSTGTEFSLKDRTNKTEGVIRRTGVFLYENGMAGTIQHVDLAMEA